MSEIASTGYWYGQEPFHAISNPLSNWIVEYLKEYYKYPIYDFGCGIGLYLLKLQNAGFSNLCGFEGEPPTNKVFNKIIKQDLTTPFNVEAKGIVISLEVAEHIPSSFADIYLDNIANACENGKSFICSWAIKGQGGHGHINELNNDEAIELIVSKGFDYLELDTKLARENISPIENIVEGELPWFKNTVLIFKKNKN